VEETQQLLGDEGRMQILEDSKEKAVLLRKKMQAREESFLRGNKPQWNPIDLKEDHLYTSFGPK
jgi:hypothetical protein